MQDFCSFCCGPPDRVEPRFDCFHKDKLRQNRQQSAIFVWSQKRKNKRKGDTFQTCLKMSKSAVFSFGRGGRGDALKKQACALVFSQSREQLVAVRPTGSSLGSIASIKI